MRADLSDLPIDSLGVRTSKVTVFTVPPRNVALEISDESVWGLEGVGSLPPIEVPVIALANLVVVAHYAYPVYHVRQPLMLPSATFYRHISMLAFVASFLQPHVNISHVTGDGINSIQSLRKLGWLSCK